MIRLLRLPAVTAANGAAKSTLYDRISQGLWTRPVKLGRRASGWPEHECNALNAARIAGKTDDQIRELVKELEAARTADREVHQ